MATGSEKRKKRRRRKVKPDNPAQSKRFIEAAKALGVDEDGETFNRVMDAILKPKGKGKSGNN